MAGVEKLKIKESSLTKSNIKILVQWTRILEKRNFPSDLIFKNGYSGGMKRKIERLAESGNDGKICFNQTITPIWGLFIIQNS